MIVLIVGIGDELVVVTVDARCNNGKLSRGGTAQNGATLDKTLHFGVIARFVCFFHLAVFLIFAPPDLL